MSSAVSHQCPTTITWQAFAGEGQVLGNPTPSVLPSTSSATPASAADLASCEKKAAAELNVVDGEPTTNIQVNSLFATLFYVLQCLNV